jgi:hypothetical protein
MAGRVELLRRFAAAVGLGSALTGCYSLRPVGGVEPKPGSKLAFEVNDAGRVALGGSMGPEIAQVEGMLVTKDSEGYLLAVSNVRLLRGGQQIWSGEQVKLNSQYLGTAYERRFSLARSIGLGVAGIGGFAVLLATRSLLGIGTDANPGPREPPITERLGRP